MIRLSQVIRFTDPPRPTRSGVYVLRREAGGLVKIGMSVDLDRRVASYGPAAELLHVVPTAKPREAEAFFHRLFQVWRVDGEWFELDEQAIERVRAWKGWPRKEGP